MRVLVLINGLGTGGAERSLSELVPALREQGIDIAVAYFVERAAGVQRAITESASSVHHISSHDFVGRVRQVRKLLRKGRFDLLHTSIFESDVVGRVAARTARTPVLSSVVNTPYSTARLGDPNVNRTRLAAVRLVDAWTARHLATRLHAITDAVAESCVDSLRVPREKVVVVPRGRELNRIRTGWGQRDRIREELKLGRDDFVILNVARQEYQKGQGVLIEAFAQLAKHRADVRLVIAGREGHASSSLRDLAQAHQLGDKVSFLGHREDVPALLFASDLFAFPSLYEGFGGAVAEAMAASIPVIASDIPALREVLADGHAGVLVPADDVLALEAAIEQLLADRDLRERVGRSGQDYFNSHFTIEACASAMAELYRSVVSTHGART